MGIPIVVPERKMWWLGRWPLEGQAKRGKGKEESFPFFDIHLVPHSQIISVISCSRKARPNAS
jgi:hypothetical protein